MSDETKNNAVPGKPITEGVENSQPSPAPSEVESIKGVQLQQPSPPPVQTSDDNSGESKK